jgi:hypothetical protein
MKTSRRQIVNHAHDRTVAQQTSNNMGTDEAGSARYKISI